MRSSVWYIDNRAGSRAWRLAPISLRPMPTLDLNRWIQRVGRGVRSIGEKRLALLSSLCARSRSRSKRRALSPLDDFSPKFTANVALSFTNTNISPFYPFFFLPPRMYFGEGIWWNLWGYRGRYPTIIIWANSLKVYLVASRHVDQITDPFNVNSAKRQTQRDTQVHDRSWLGVRVVLSRFICLATIQTSHEGLDFVEGVLGDRFLPIASSFLAEGRNDCRRRSDISRIIHSSTSICTIYVPLPFVSSRGHP